MSDTTIGAQKVAWKKPTTWASLVIREVSTRGRTITNGMTYIIHSDEPKNVAWKWWLANTLTQPLRLMNALGPSRAELAKESSTAPKNGNREKA